MNNERIKKMKIKPKCRSKIDEIENQKARKSKNLVQNVWAMKGKIVSGLNDAG